MALTLNANWRDAIEQATVEPRVVASYAYPSSSNELLLTDGTVAFTETLAQIVAAIKQVSAFSRNMNPITREMALSKLSLSLGLNEALIDWIVNQRLLGQKLSVALGAAGLARADYEWIFRNGRISRVKPNRTQSTVALEIESGTSWLGDTIIDTFWPAISVLDALKDILTRANTPAENFVASDYDPSGAQYTTISHLVAFGYQKGNALQMFERLASTIDGTAYIDEQNRIRFKLFDPTAAIVDTWTDDDILDLSQGDAHGAVLNSVIVRGKPVQLAPQPDGTQGDYQFGYKRQDTNSITNWGTREQQYELWGFYSAAYPMALISDITAGQGDGTTFFVSGLPGHTGTRFPNYPTPGQPADATITTDRTGFLRVGREVIEVREFSAFDGTLGYPYRDQFDNEITARFPARGRFRIKTRGALGTTATAHAKAVTEFLTIPGPTGGTTVDIVVSQTPAAKVYDITPAVLLAKAKLDRFYDGAPVVEVRTPLRKFNVQISDFVALSTSQYLGFGKNGIDSTFKWEVVGKEVEVHANPPSIKWTLIRAADSGAPAQTLSNLLGLNQGAVSYMPIAALDGAATASATLGHVLNGLGTTNSGLNITVEAGSVASDGAQYAMPENFTFTATVSKDTYIFFDTVQKSITRYEVNNGASPPEGQASEIPLSVVVTNASTVTGITDLRRLSPLNGQKLLNNSLTSNKAAWEGTHILVDNPNLELGDVGWSTKTNGWGIVLDAANARNGSWVARLQGNGSFARLQNDQIFKVVAGMQYVASAWAKNVSANGDFRVRIRWLDINKAEITTSQTTITSAASYTQVSVTGTAPGNAVYAHLEIGGNANTTGSWYADDMSVQELIINNKIAANAVSSDKAAWEGTHILADNPNFELGNIGWDLDPDITINNDPTNARNGSWVLTVPASSGVGKVATNSQVFKVKEGQRFKASAWWKSAPGANGESRVRISWLNASKTEIAVSTSGAIAASTTYTQGTIEANAPAGAEYARFVTFRSSTGHTTGTWYCDDVLMQEIMINEKIGPSAVSSAKMAPEGSSNMCDNPNLELGDVGWRKDPGFTIENDPTNARNGNWVARHAGSVGANGLQNEQFIAVKPGERLRASAWIKLAGGATVGMATRIRFVNVTKGSPTAITGPTITSTTYAVSEVEGEVPAGAAYAHIEMLRLGSSSGNAWCDDFRIQKITTYGQLDLTGQLGGGLIFNSNMKKFSKG